MTPPDLHADVLSRLAAAETVEAAGTLSEWTSDAGRLIGPDAEPQFMRPEKLRALGIIRLSGDAHLIAAARNAYPAALRWVRQTVTEHEPHLVSDDGGGGWVCDEADDWPCATYAKAAAVLGVHIPPHDEEQACE